MLWLLTLVFTFLPTYLLRFQIGPLPTTVLEILVWITIITWIYLKIKNRDWSLLPTIPHRSLFLSATGLFLLGATIGIFISPDFRAALGEWKAFYFEPIIIALVIADTVKTKADITKILGGLVLGSLTAAVLGVYQHFTGWLVPHSFWANRNTYRVTGWYGFPNGVGLLLAPLIPFAVYLAFESGKSIKEKTNLKKNYLWGILGTLFIFFAPLAIIFAKTTAALVGLAAGAGIFLLCFQKTRWPALILGGLGFMGLFFLPNNPVTNELLAKDYSGQLRRDIWTETVTYLKDNPIVGSGIAGYTSEITPLRKNKTIEVFHHPHNIFLTMWVNSGLIGLIGFTALLVWFYATTLKNLQSQHRALAITVLTTMTIWLTMGLVDSPYIKNDWALLFWLYLVLASHITKLNSNH